MNETRPSVLAGAWYPADPKQLATSIDGHLAQGRPLAQVARHLPVAIIAPHAGHQWSGDAAAHVYRLLEGEAGRALERIILIGPSHRVSFRGASIPTVQAYETPLGTVPLDTNITTALLDQPGFQSVESAHRQEHCLEIQLPFLQQVLKHPYRIVPILISHMESSEWKRIADALAPYIDARTLILISSDFTHYGQRFGYLPFTDDPDRNLKRLDLGALVPMLALDPEGLARYKRETDVTVCGYQPIGILLELLRDPKVQNLWGGGRPEGRVLEYYRSADLLGDFEGSVSYASVAFFRPGDLLEGEIYPAALQGVEPWQTSSGKDQAAGSTMKLNAQEKRFLLYLARRTLQEVLAGKPTPDVKAYPQDVSPENMQTVCGVFVTLTKQKRLRGCIGSIEGKEALVDGVIHNAVNAALKDPRFPPVEINDLTDLEIEISVLTPLERVASPEEIKIGRHGVLLEKSGRRAVFLPQVAPEQGWELETTL
ncbi:MAG: AmmeMemoRadiSam system protein B, partial [Candidatus Eisenbacteria sp.]|nr:AmmeMemoRadiSam system protein B [Candidatus Eisenbacteria bacterium]